MTEPLVTIVIVARDRFCCSEESLENVYKNTESPFKLIYIDGGSPSHIRDYLANAALEKKFSLIRQNHYLAPNQARNMALAQVKTKYAVFADNDVVVMKGWLSELINCAEETGCAIVSPLTCQDMPFHENIHFAGGELEIKEEKKDGEIQRFIHETHTYKQGIKHFEINPPLKRGPIGYTEAHCFLIRTDILKKVNGFDENVKGTREHVDFSLMVRQAGGMIYLEPKSIMTFMSHFSAAKLEPWEEDFYNLRWSDAWEYDTLKYLLKKWDLTESSYFKKRYNNLGWRRRAFSVKPKVQNVKPRILKRLMEEVLIAIDKVNNKKLTDDFARKSDRKIHYN